MPLPKIWIKFTPGKPCLLLRLSLDKNYNCTDKVIFYVLLQATHSQTLSDTLTRQLQISQDDLNFLKKLKAQPKNISDAIKAMKKRNKSGANTQPDSDAEECDDE